MDFRIAPMAAREPRRRVGAVGRKCVEGTALQGSMGPAAARRRPFSEMIEGSIAQGRADETYENENEPRSELDGSGDGTRRKRRSVAATG